MEPMGKPHGRGDHQEADRQRAGDPKVSQANLGPCDYGFRGWRFMVFGVSSVVCRGVRA